ncbi:hypothetical protein [Synechococcus sp. 1G10]|uniref:hypothetical protein n=1 Tax=Synechococcus sp. 1G10 TaxID=2025605 RepID=UPI00117CCA2E|nr:hypothetical protein [Synechococcus sp. 1G10]
MSEPPTLVLFGAGSLCGEALIEQLPLDTPWLCLGRRQPPGTAGHQWRLCDLSDLSPEGLAAAASALPPGPQIWIAFVHIWLMAPFLEALLARQPQALAGLRRVVACSSSSVITKRFEGNRFDRELVQRLNNAQQQLLDTCASLSVPACILAPTLIYGRTEHHADRNVEALRRLLRRLPLLPLPAHTGLRQPIAAADLAAVALEQGRALLTGAADSAVLPVGGDETLSYHDMLERIQAGDPRAAYCRMLALPTPLFQWLASVLLLVSPKTFAAVQRLSADLAGFPRAADLLRRAPRPFDVQAP